MEPDEDGCRRHRLAFGCWHAAPVAGVAAVAVELEVFPVLVADWRQRLAAGMGEDVAVVVVVVVQRQPCSFRPTSFDQRWPPVLDKFSPVAAPFF